MTDPGEQPWRLPDEPECVICGDDLLDGDVVVRPVHPPDGPDATASGRAAHITCTKEGIERWCRENRPMPVPILWERSERPTWHAADPSDERSLAVVHRLGRGDDARWQARAVAGRVGSERARSDG